MSNRRRLIGDYTNEHQVCRNSGNMSRTTDLFILRLRKQSGGRLSVLLLTIFMLRFTKAIVSLQIEIQWICHYMQTYSTCLCGNDRKDSVCDIWRYLCWVLWKHSHDTQTFRECIMNYGLIEHTIAGTIKKSQILLTTFRLRVTKAIKIQWVCH